MSDTEPTGPLPPPPETGDLPPPPHRPRRRLRTLLIAVLVAVALFGVYRFLGDRQFHQAQADLRAGRCQAAVDGFDKVAGFYAYSGSGNVDAARQGAAECRMFLAAEEVPSGQYATATQRYRAFLGRYTGDPLVRLGQERLAVVYARWGDQQIGEGDYDGGIGKYATVLREFATTKAVGPVQTAVQGLIDDASADARSPSTACTSVEILLALIDGDVSAASARHPLPTAYYQCARKEVKGHRDADAIDHLHALLRDFPNSALKAKSLLVDARVDQVRRGVHVRLGSPQRTGSAPAGQVVLSFQNSSPHRFELLVSGPVSKSMVVGKCDTCRQYGKGEAPPFCPGAGPTLTMTLPPGTYRVVFHDPDTATTKDGYEVWTLTSGSEYGGCNLLTKS